MKKYIIPAVDVTAMHVENTVMATSFVVSETPVGGPDDLGPGQLTNGWNADDWGDTDM
mgnify:CR=1 FL=1